jgi:hypothetical protein
MSSWAPRIIPNPSRTIERDRPRHDRIGLRGRRRRSSGLDALADDGVVLRKDFAGDEGLAVGDTLALTTPGGVAVRRVLTGVYAPSRFSPLLGQVLLAQDDFDATFPQPKDTLVLLGADGGPTAAATEALQTALGPFPDSRLETRAELSSRAPASSTSC